MAKIYDFYKYVDKYKNKTKIKTLDDSSRQKTEDEKCCEIIEEMERIVNKLNLGIYDYVE